MADRKASFWLPLTLQTVALLVAANASQLAEAHPTERNAKYLFTEADDAFVYNLKNDVSNTDFGREEFWVGESTRGSFDYPVLLEESDRLLLGAIDHYDGAGREDDDWLFVY